MAVLRTELLVSDVKISAYDTLGAAVSSGCSLTCHQTHRIAWRCVRSKPPEVAGTDHTPLGFLPRLHGVHRQVQPSQKVLFRGTAGLNFHGSITTIFTITREPLNERKCCIGSIDACCLFRHLRINWGPLNV